MVAILIMGIAVAISNTIGGFFPRLSNSYFEIIAGVVIAAVPAINHTIPPFNFEIFMLVISPLLFFEAQVTAVGDVAHNFRKILSVSGLLVLISMLVVGTLLHLSFGVSLGLGLVLAIVSAPTDATALGAVSEGVKMDADDHELLSLEGLFNDATGLVLLQVAVIFLVSNHISLGSASLNFLQNAGGGILTGLLSGLAIIAIRNFQLRFQVNISLAITLVYLLSPFAIFFIAEEFHFSGILAVVTAGIVGNGENQRIRFVSPRQSRWGIDLVSSASEFLNGAAFVSLGMLVTRIMIQTTTTLTDAIMWVTLGTALYITSLLVRYIYIRLSAKKSNRSGWVFAIGGVHGAVNFALALSIAEDHLTQNAFITIVMAEATFILLSMIVPPILFQFFLPAATSPRILQAKTTEIKQQMVDYALSEIKKMDLAPHVLDAVTFDLGGQANKMRVVDLFRAWYVTNTSGGQFSATDRSQERDALHEAFVMERKFLGELYDQEPNFQGVLNNLYNEVLLAESVALDPNGPSNN